MSISHSILELDSADATLARAGGKGANLAILSRAGFAVPPGFIVTTEAYRAFVIANGIGAGLLETAQALPPDDLAELEASSQEIRALFNLGTLSAQFAQRIQAAYANLPAAGDGPPAVAVRSSATAEDLPGASFAGQQDTYLNVIGPEALIEAVKSCWGSLWTARAMSYRARNHIPPDDVALAVVVQIMIPAEVSGILFTANPVTGQRRETVIDASFGLGEAIVSGQVEPDHYVVETGDMQVTARKFGAKALAIVPRRAGGIEPVLHERSQVQALSDAQILNLARIGTQVADHFGSPQDIEWAWAGDQLYLLQSRPITSLYPLPESLLRSDHLRILFSLNSVQGVIEPLTPLGLDIVPILISGILRNAGVRRAVRDIAIAAGGRLYVDITPLLEDRRLQRVLLTFFTNVDPGAQQAMQKLVTDGRIETTTKIGTPHLLRLIVSFRSILAGGVLTGLRPEAMRRRAIRRADMQIAQLRQTVKHATTLQTRLAVIDQVVPGSLLELIVRTIGPVMVPGLLMQAVVGRWLTDWIEAERGAVRLLLRGAPGNPTTEMDLRLWAAAKTIQSDEMAKAYLLGQSASAIASAFQRGELPALAQKVLGEFLDSYGMRAVGEIDLGRPRWREDPQSIIQNLSSYVQIGDPKLAPDRLFQQAGEEAERLAASYVARVRERKGKLRARLLSAMIQRMRLLGGMREVPKFYIIQVLDLLRTALFELGARIGRAGAAGTGRGYFLPPTRYLTRQRQWSIDGPEEHR